VYTRDTIRDAMIFKNRFHPLAIDGDTKGCRKCDTHQHKGDSCPNKETEKSRDTEHIQLLRETKDEYTVTLDNPDDVSRCMTVKGGTGPRERPIFKTACFDSGASQNYTSIATLTAHGKRLEVGEESPIRSATGQASVERLAEVTLRVFPLNNQGRIVAPIDIIQEIRLLPQMEQGLTLISAGAVLTKLTEIYPGRDDGSTAPQVTLKAAAEGLWSRITLHDRKKDQFLHVPLKQEGRVFYIRCQFMRNGVKLETEGPSDRAKKQDVMVTKTANEVTTKSGATVTMSRPQLKVTRQELHYILLHMSDKVINKFIEYYPEVSITTPTMKKCETCGDCLGKRQSNTANTRHTRKPHTKSKQTVEEDIPVLSELSLDPVPIPASSCAGSQGIQWLWVIVDRRSKYLFLRFSKFKSAATKVVESVLTEIHKMNLAVRTIKHDGGAEMSSIGFNLMMDKWGIRNISTLPYTPNHNRSERYVQFIKERMRTTLHSAKLPLSEFWVRAANDVAFKHNLIPKEALCWDTPWRLVHGSKAKIHRLRTFGSIAHVVRPADLHKSRIHTLAPIATKCILLENDLWRPGHHIYRLDGKRSSVTQDLIVRNLTETRQKPLQELLDMGLVQHHAQTHQPDKYIPSYMRDIIKEGDGYDYGNIQSIAQNNWSQAPTCPVKIRPGLTIARQFTVDDKVKWYTGTVDEEYTDEQGTQQFVIIYEDGDSEDLDIEEYTNLLLLWGKATARNLPNVPAFPEDMYEASNTTGTGNQRLTHDDIVTEIEEIRTIDESHNGFEEELPYSSANDNEIGGDGVDEEPTTNGSINDNADKETSSDEENDQRMTPTREVEANVIPDGPRRSGRVRKERTIFDPSSTPNTNANTQDDITKETMCTSEAGPQDNIFFIATNDEETLLEDDHDGVFTIDVNNKVIESVIRAGERITPKEEEAESKHSDTHDSAFSAKTLNYRQAMKGPHAPEYKEAADSEIAQLNRLDVFRYCSQEEMLAIDPLAKPILLGWVLVRKVCAVTGKLIKTKGRIYRRGDLEQPEINYDPAKTHSSNVHLDAVKFMIAMAATHGLHVISMDVSGAFLRSRPTRLTFVKLPEGYKVFDKNNREMVAICTRALYGGKDCGRSWQEDRDSTILEQKWIRSIADPNIFRTVAKMGGDDSFNEQGAEREDIFYNSQGVKKKMKTESDQEKKDETIEECLNRVKKHLASIETSYQKREDWLKEQETNKQKQVQHKRKEAQSTQNARHKAYYTTRSDDVQGKNGHFIPQGEEFPELHSFDEKLLCSNLPTNDEKGILFANMAVFTDDILIVTNNRKFGLIMAQGFMEVHPGKIEDKPATFLGLGMEYGKDGEITLSQRNLIKDMMGEGNMVKCAPAHTPITTPINKEERPEDDSEQAKKALDKIYPYMRVCGQAIWLRQTRPDIIYATSQWARVSSNPGLTHHAAIKRGVRYLSGTRNRGTIYGKHKYSNNDPYVICDANHDETCVSGMVAVYGGAVFAGRSWVQQGSQLHSFAAEKVALTDATKMACWVKDLAMDLGVPVGGPIVIYDDNQALIRCVKNENTSSKTRHLRIRMAWVKQMIKEQRVEVRYVTSTENISDALTKPLTRIPFVFCREQMLGEEQVAIRVRDLENRAQEKADEENYERERKRQEDEKSSSCYSMRGVETCAKYNIGTREGRTKYREPGLRRKRELVEETFEKKLAQMRIGRRRQAKGSKERKIERRRDKGSRRDQLRRWREEERREQSRARREADKLTQGRKVEKRGWKKRYKASIRE
jgi:hypothetical protein